MKKSIFLFLTLASSLTYGQKHKLSYKVGVVTGLPANVLRANINTGSTLVEVSKKVSPKVSATANAGYFRTTSDVTISQVPLWLGAKYHMNDNWYFGAGAGVSVPTKKAYGETEFSYSPYLGYQKDHISADVRYYLSGLDTPLSTFALVFSFTF